MSLPASTFCRSVITFRDPPASTKPLAEPAFGTEVETMVDEDSYVYVHCHFNNTESGALVRIWKTTFLMDQSSGSKSDLVHAENISFAPAWTAIADRTPFSFLLIFSALPKSCLRFDLREEISQPGGFLVTNISRNETDVYHIDIK